MGLQDKPRAPVLSTEETERGRGITPRAVIIGLAAIVPATFWNVYGEVVSRTDLTSTSMMMPPVLVLVALLLFNGAARRFRPNWALSQREMLTVYIMMTVSVVLSGMGVLQFLLPTLGATYYYATPENKWAGFLKYAPKWFFPSNPKATFRGFYNGNAPVPWDAWVTPILVWGGFLFALLLCMFAINVIVRKHWIDRERLTFPIVFLPLQMTDSRSGFFSNRLMWLGFLIPVVLESVNSLSFLFPAVPRIQLRAHDLSQYFIMKPWNAMGYFPTTFYPLTIGLGFILSTDVSFSCWFFYVLTKLENVFASAAGFRDPGVSAALAGFPYLAQQGVGAFIGLAAVVVYSARRHIRDVVRSAIHRTKEIDDSDEPMSYRTTLLVLAGAFAFLLLFTRIAGMSIAVAFIYLTVYLIFSFTITRMRAEVGPAWTMGPDWNARETMVSSIGSASFSARNLTMLSYLNWFSTELRCDPMPSQLEAFKLNQASRNNQRVMMGLMLLAIIVGILAGFWACLSVWYHFGASSAKVEPWRTNMGAVPFHRLTDNLAFRRGPAWPGIQAMVLGGLAVLWLTSMRMRFVGFPFHPAGYVLANTGTMYWLWMPFFVAWACKVIIIRYGGIKLYRSALPFFLGLVLGDYVISSLWALAGSVFGVEMYRCFPC